MVGTGSGSEKIGTFKTEPYLSGTGGREKQNYLCSGIGTLYNQCKYRGGLSDASTLAVHSVGTVPYMLEKYMKLHGNTGRLYGKCYVLPTDYVEHCESC